MQYMCFEHPDAPFILILLSGDEHTHLTLVATHRDLYYYVMSVRKEGGRKLAEAQSSPDNHGFIGPNDVRLLVGDGELGPLPDQMVSHLRRKLQGHPSPTLTLIKKAIQDQSQ